MKEIEARVASDLIPLKNLCRVDSKYESCREQLRVWWILQLKMSFLIVLLGIGTLLHCCSTGAHQVNGHEKIAGDHLLGTENLPLTPLPQNEVSKQFQGNYPFALGYRPQKCPLCDSLVYPYCGEKLLHDACCCTESHHDLPYQCRLADCRFLHARTCREHRLIANCCCSVDDDYRAILKSLAQG
ncbi:hypothetical protein DMN91_003704 [Ooceraea biroi]|uniref:Uncharacterized protein n=1 Tax=Ooceraea biroi TaxID=2015173 RepID=A0A3L8DUB8_OOCBI|nr:hypothetical protein DMN91_003704 [Ooceraea biroi]